VITLSAFFLAIDLAFLGANTLKIAAGGWVPLVIAVGMLTLMTTWKRGREILGALMRQASMPIDLLLDDIGRRTVHRVSGTAVFMTSDAQGAPVVLLHHLKHNQALHKQVVLLSVQSAEVPEVADDHRVQVAALPQGFYRVTARYGFMETPDVPEILAMSAAHGLVTTPQQTSYYLGRERLIPTGRSGMARWRRKLFVFMARNARSATEFFGLPPNRVVELGTQIEF
jgi:KUP system potassium uptake protein